MRSAIVLAVLLGCGRGGGGGGGPATVPVKDAEVARVVDAGAVDAATGPAVRWRADVVVPVAALAGRRFAPVAGWLQPVDGAKAVLADRYPVPTRIEATPKSSVQPRVLAGDDLPASWRAAVGATVAAYDRAGQRCATTISGLYWLGVANGEWEMGEEPAVVAELSSAPGCDPVVITDRPEPRFAAPTKANPAQRAAVERAFRTLPGVKRQGRDREMSGAIDATLFVGADGAWMVAAAEFGLRDVSCDPEEEVIRGVFALPATGAPVLVGELDDELSTRTVTVLDSDHDGHLELVTGAATFDHGMSLNSTFVGYRDLGPAPGADDGPADEVAFSSFFGCD